MKKVILALLIAVIFPALMSTSAFSSEPASYIISLTAGDWGGDGHEKTQDFYVVSNLKGKEIGAAYDKATKLLGFDYVNEVAVEYEDSRLPKKFLKKMRELGMKIELEDEKYHTEDNYVSINSEEYATIWLEIVKLGNPGFTWSFLKTEARLDIGGYGLFY